MDSSKYSLIDLPFSWHKTHPKSQLQISYSVKHGVSDFATEMCAISLVAIIFMEDAYFM